MGGRGGGLHAKGEEDKKQLSPRSDGNDDDDDDDDRRRRRREGRQSALSLLDAWPTNDARKCVRQVGRRASRSVGRSVGPDGSWFTSIDGERDRDRERRRQEPVTKVTRRGARCVCTTRKRKPVGRRGGSDTRGVIMSYTTNRTSLA